MEVMHCGRAAQIEEVLAQADVASIASLSVADVSKAVLDDDALAQLGVAGEARVLEALVATRSTSTYRSMRSSSGPERRA